MEPDRYEKALSEKLKYEFREPTFKIVHDHHLETITDTRKRQIDVAIFRKGESRPFFIADAKRYKRKIGVKTVDSFLGMMIDVGVKLGLIAAPQVFPLELSRGLSPRVSSFTC